MSPRALVIVSLVVAANGGCANDPFYLDSPNTLDGGADDIRVGDVGSHEPAADLGRQRLAALGVEVGNHHVRATGVQVAHRCLAQAGGAARDQGA